MRYRININTQGLGIKLEIIVVEKLISMLVNKTCFRPRVSATKPHRCELLTTPKKLIADRIDFSGNVRLRSHWAAGIINIIPMVSMITTIKHKPQDKSRNRLNQPYPKKKQYSFFGEGEFRMFILKLN